MSVLLNNIDDFIVPSQACINPLIEKKPEDIKVQSSSTKKLTLTVDATQSDFEIENKLMKPNLIQLKNSSSSTKKVASISLNDCLACRYIFLYFRINICPVMRCNIFKF
jgi:hypothetical protein